MIEDRESLPHKILFLMASLLVTGGLLILVISLWHNTNNSTVSNAPIYNSGASSSDSPNVVTTGLSEAMHEFGQSVGNTLQAMNGVGDIGESVGSAGQTAGQTVATAATDTGGAIAGAGKAVVRGIGHGVGLMFAGIGSGISFVFHIPLNIVSSIIHAPVVSAAIRPADHTAVPVIDPNSPELAAAQKALPAEAPTPHAGPQLPPEPLWPIHGAITTEFGVPEWPYQPIHTGIDISDGTRPGTTPVRPYRHGKVVQVITNGGLGNHVVVDHGSGVTSVYGHMASIAVHVGQDVDTNTTLGMEGTTGASTGTHLHFEIRVNGQAANPHQFIPGRP